MSSWLGSEDLARFSAAGTTAHRVFSGPSAWIERFGTDALISAPDEAQVSKLQRELEQWPHFHFRRIFGRQLVHGPGAANLPFQLSGPANGSLQTEVIEAGVKYHLDFAAGYSTGLFLDQRANRARLVSLKPKRILNLFAYTCSFSVVAALAGADTLSVDLARKALDWGRRNFRLNGLADSEHGFVAADVREYLPRLIRRGERFDAIILDPPTFSRGEKGKVFRVGKEMESLAGSAFRLLQPGGALLLSTNSRELSPANLDPIARSAASLAGCRIEIAAAPDQPDFRTGLAASTRWAFVR